MNPEWLNILLTIIGVCVVPFSVWVVNGVKTSQSDRREDALRIQHLGEKVANLEAKQTSLDSASRSQHDVQTKLVNDFGHMAIQLDELKTTSGKILEILLNRK